MTLDEFFERILPMVVTVGEYIKADDDWAPVVFTLGPSGFETNLLDLRDDVDKELIYRQIVPKLVRQKNATLVATVNTAWVYSEATMAKIRAVSGMAEVEKLVQKIGQPSRQPDRAEVVFVSAYDTLGACRLAEASIVRGGPHPRLSEWRCLPQQGELKGRVPEPIIAALKANRKARD